MPPEPSLEQAIIVKIRLMKRLITDMIFCITGFVVVIYFECTNGKMVMINDKKVLWIEVFTE